MGDWAEKQGKLKAEYFSLWKKEHLTPDENSRVEELRKEYFEVCKGEAREDMEKGYLHQLTDVTLRHLLRWKSG